MLAFNAAAAAWSPPANETVHGRALMSHEFLRSGSFCLGNKLAPLAFLLGCQRCGTNSLYEDIMGSVKGARRGHALFCSENCIRRPLADQAKADLRRAEKNAEKR